MGRENDGKDLYTNFQMQKARTMHQESDGKTDDAKTFLKV